MSLLFIGKKDDPCCQRALEFVETHFPDAAICLGQRGEPFPNDLLSWKGNTLVSYLSPWIIPQALLENTRVNALNFHPGPPEYPGIGCTNFALYNGEIVYGVTCHHMAAKVDTGPIIAVRRFPVFPTDTVWSVTQRCYAHILVLFYEMASKIMAGEPLPVSAETWTREPYKRRELNELCRLTPDMTPEEQARRIRATTYPGMPGAWFDRGDGVAETSK